MLREEDDYGARLSRIYAEKYEGLRQQLSAVDRNVLKFIAEGRDRGIVLDAAMKQFTICATEIKFMKFWGGVAVCVFGLAFILLYAGVIALLIKVF